MEYNGPRCNQIKERSMSLNDLEARLLESTRAHQADQANWRETILELTHSNKNLEKKMAFLYTEMTDLKSRLDRFDALHLGLNTQLETIMSKLERLKTAEMTQSVLDKVDYLQLRFKVGVGDLYVKDQPQHIFLN